MHGKIGVVVFELNRNMKRTIEHTKKDLKEMISEAKSEVPTKEGLYYKLCEYEIACCKYFRESAPEEIEKSFGCDPSKHVFCKYGISLIQIQCDDNIVVHLGKFHEYFIYDTRLGEGEKEIVEKSETNVVYKLHLSKNLEKVVKNYFLKLIEEKNNFMNNIKCYFEHFEEKLENYLQIAKQYLKKINEKEGENYKAYLTKGNSLSNKRLDSAIVITNNDYQVGYIRITPYEKYGYINFDSCYIGGGHVLSKMDVMSNSREYVENACRLAI